MTNDEGGAVQTAECRRPSADGRVPERTIFGFTEAEAERIRRAEDKRRSIAND